MELKTISTLQLEDIRAECIAAICLRAALRVRPLMPSLKVEDCAILGNAIACARFVLLEEEDTSRLMTLSENVYQIAATNAVRFRNDPSMVNERCSIAGVIIHSAIDCVADFETDERAARANAMLTLRSCGKLSVSSIECAVIADLQQDGTNKSTPRSGVLDQFGPLWPNDPPDWFVKGLDV